MDKSPAIRPGAAALAVPFDCTVLPPEWLEYGVKFGVDGRLYFAEWRAGFTVHQARAMFFEVQLLRSLQRDVLRMRAELDALGERVDVSEKRAAFYRSQLRLESSMGAMLSRIVGAAS